jgi:hypothetical protein
MLVMPIIEEILRRVESHIEISDEELREAKK